MIRSPLGMLGGAVLVLSIIGVVSAPVVIAEVWTVGFSVAGALMRTAYMFLFGAVLLYLALAGVGRGCRRTGARSGTFGAQQRRTVVSSSRGVVYDAGRDGGRGERRAKAD